MASDKKWLTATLRKASMVAENLRMMEFDVPGFGLHKPGQHVDVRLTASGGYMAERSYSLGNAPEMDVVELGVQILEGGEVSPYLWDIQPGAQVEVRGPLGGHFIWTTTMPGPLVMIAGGSGTVPMMSMLREHMKVVREERVEGKNTESARQVILAISARKMSLLPYWDELKKIQDESLGVGVKILATVTDDIPVEWSGRTGRFDKTSIQEILAPVQGLMPMVYICGPTAFVEAMATYTVESGINPHEVRTERFGG
jgi:ferredoxin-NADP reductase